VRCRSAVLDGEIVCLQPDGRSHFYNLMFRREWPYFMAFDVLSINGRDVRQKPHRERKRLLAGIMPLVESRIRLVEGICGRGIDFFRVACEHDLEGIVAKWKHGTYTNGPRTSWMKIRNPHYSQWEGRRELFDGRSGNATRRRFPAKPQLALV
jgi:bifunctional non-homologous end joining protein LigD